MVRWGGEERHRQATFPDPFPASVPTPNQSKRSPPGPSCFQPNGHTCKLSPTALLKPPAPVPTWPQALGILLCSPLLSGSYYPTGLALFLCLSSLISDKSQPGTCPDTRRPPCRTWSATRAGSRGGPDRQRVSSQCGSPRAPGCVAAAPGSAPGACRSAAWAGPAGASP